MPRRPKPKNTLSAGERAAIYEAEQKMKQAAFSGNDMPSEKSEADDYKAITMPKDTEIKETKPQKAKKELPKPQKAVVRADFSLSVGRVLPMHGMCNGPVSYGADISQLFKEIGVPAVRFDCTDTPSSGYAVDISRIFKNLDADPSDENNYDFSVTDKYIEAARLAGADVVLRLGESRDPYDTQRRARRPEDVDVLARVCINVIRHYNDRWARGYSLGLTRVELWSRSLSSGKEDLAEDMEIYRRLANAVKLYDDSLLVGGLSFEVGRSELGEFLRYCKKNRVPVDFLTLDCFGDDPKALIDGVAEAARIAGNLGYADIEVLIGKWAISESQGSLSGARVGRGDLKDAAFSGAMLLGLGETIGACGAFAFDAQPAVSPWCGLADRAGNRQKPFYAFKAFGELYRAGNRVLCTCEQTEGCAHNGIYASAAVSEDGKGYLMIAAFDGCDTVDVRLDGISENVYEAEVFMLDGVKNLESAGTVAVSGAQKRLVLNVSSYGVFLIKLF